MIAKMLRYKPKSLGLTLENGGWVSLDKLHEALTTKRIGISWRELIEIANRNDKFRFVFDSNLQRLRVNEFHRVLLKKGYGPSEPPEILFLIIPEVNKEIIFEQGIQPLKRRQIRLYTTIEESEYFWAKYADPLFFRVNSKEMFDNGHIFYYVPHDFWYTDTISSTYLRLVSGQARA